MADPPPSVEADEFVAAILNSPRVRVAPHPLIYGQNALMLVEYIPANFQVAAYHVGCGRDQTLAISVDAVRRSRAIQNPYSAYLMAFFNAFGHSDNLLVATKPLPGTDYIPEDPLSEVLLPLIDKDTGPVRLTEELARV